MRKGIQKNVYYLWRINKNENKSYKKMEIKIEENPHNQETWYKNEGTYAIK